MNVEATATMQIESISVILKVRVERVSMQKQRRNSFNFESFN